MMRGRRVSVDPRRRPDAGRADLGRGIRRLGGLRISGTVDLL
jgi:hypothetical protein